MHIRLSAGFVIYYFEVSLGGCVGGIFGRHVTVGAGNSLVRNAIRGGGSQQQEKQQCMHI